MATKQQEPKPPFPKQHQDKPGLESEMKPRPNYKAPLYKGSGKLQGKAALITGGDSGIGRAVAVLFAREGADVAIVYLKEEQSDADETKRAVEKEGRKCRQLPGDLCDPSFCKEAVERTVRELGKLDVLVNNAAYQNRKKDLEEISDEEFDRTFQTNIYAYFRLARAALPHLKPGSAIIATGSITGLEGNSGLPDYSATKGAIHAFSKSLAKSLAPKGVRVNVVAPGPVWTPLQPSDQGRRRRSWRSSANRRRWGGRDSRKTSRRRMCSSRRRPIPASSPAKCWPCWAARRRRDDATILPGRKRERRTLHPSLTLPARKAISM